MIIVLKQGTTQQEIDTVTNAVVARGVSVSPIVGTEMTILGLTGDTSRIDPDQLESFHCVERIMKVAEPFKKANRAFHPAPSEIKIGNTVVGGKKLAIMAGPCSVESNEQITAVAQAVKDAGATVLRGGAFKPRTSPYSFQGLAYEGLDMLCHAREQTGHDPAGNRHRHQCRGCARRIRQPDCRHGDDHPWSDWRHKPH